MKKPVSMIDYYSDQKSNKRKQAMENVAQKNEKSISGAIKVDELKRLWSIWTPWSESPLKIP